MKVRHLLLIGVLVMSGQTTFAQSGKNIAGVSHVYETDPGNHEESSFEYDARGRMIHAKSIDYRVDGGYPEEDVWTTDYTYDDAAGTITSNTALSSGGATYTFVVVAKLTGGLITEITVDEYLSAYHFTEKLTMEYDASGRVVKSATTSDIHEYSESTIIWEDGNVLKTIDVESGHDTNIMYHIYDMTRPAPRNKQLAYMIMGMPIDVSSCQMMMGMYEYMGYAPKNLVVGVKKERNGSISKERNFVYEYDADGDISRIECYSDGTLTDTFVFGLSAAGVQEIEMEKADAPFYTLQGYQTSAPRKGSIIIRNGRKVVSK